MFRDPRLALIAFLLFIGALMWVLGRGYGWNLVSAADLLLYVFSVGVLGWFVFGVIGRKLWRARRIRGFREGRLLREAAERTKDPR